jgi:hypothetical protein
MITGFDKALVTAVISVIAVINFAFGTHLGLSVDQQNGILAILAMLNPLLTYVIPNLKNQPAA